MRLLMISTEYPPMRGGVGRYTENLTKALRKLGLEVFVACGKPGNGDFCNLSPTNPNNSEIIVNIVSKIRPDLVHVQFEPGMYGLIIDAKNTKNSGTYIDSFYRTHKDIPIVTTFHSGYSLNQWISIAALIKRHGRIGRAGIPLRFLIRLWKYVLNYRTFKNINKEKIVLSKESIVFSRYMQNLLGGGQVIYHGAEPIGSSLFDKKKARTYFSLPLGGRIALAVGFTTATKGWDILKLVNLPNNWTIVCNSSKSYYNTENLLLKWDNVSGEGRRNKIIDLNRGFLSEQELSTLLCAADILILPYKVTAASGVMFDGLAHGLPFVATNLKFFREFADKGLGITTKRNAGELTNALRRIDVDYSNYAEAVNSFKANLKWDNIAAKHLSIYNSIVK